MALLRPWIGKQDKRAVNRLGFELTEQWSGIVSVQAYVYEVFLVDGCQHSDHTIAKWLASNYANLWIFPGLPKQVLTTSETDFQPQRVIAIVEDLCCAKWVG